MKKRKLVLAAAFVMIGTHAYAGNGDLIVNGKLGVGITTPGSLLDVKYSGNPVQNIYRATDSNNMYRWRVDQLFNMVMTNAAGQDTMAILNNGSVGIGTNSPSSTLDVVGTVSQKDGYDYTQLAQNGWGGSHALVFGASQSSPQVAGDLLVPGQFKYSQNAGAYSYGAGGIVYLANGGQMSFVVSPVSTGAGNIVNWGTPVMSLFRNGNVGIGVASPRGKLDIGVAGNYPNIIFDIDTTTANDNSDYFIKTRVNGGVTEVVHYMENWMGNYIWQMGWPSGPREVMRMASTGNLLIAGSLLQGSDQNLKKDIQDLSGTLGKLKEMKGIYYKWKGETLPQDKQVGVIAQDVEKVFPELVKEIENPTCSSQAGECANPLIKAVDYPKLSVIALQGVKELSDKVDDLEKRLAKLEQLVIK